MFCVGGEVKLWFCFLLLERKYWFIWRKWKWLRKLPHRSEKIKWMHSHVCSLSLLQQLNTIFSVLAAVLPAIIKDKQWIFISSVTIGLDSHGSAYLEKYFEDKGVRYNPSLDGDLWHCQLLLLPTSSMRVLHRHQVCAVSIQTGWGKCCNVFLMLPFQRKAEISPKHRNPRKKIDVFNSWSDNILGACLVLFQLLMEDGGQCCP